MYACSKPKKPNYSNEAVTGKTTLRFSHKVKYWQQGAVPEQIYELQDGGQLMQLKLSSERINSK